MSSYSNYVPWRNRESSYSGSSTKGSANSGRSSSERTTPTATPVARKERDSYAGLSNYRPPPTTNVRCPTQPGVRDREAKYGTPTGGGPSVASQTRARYPRSYSGERTPSSELELASPIKEKQSASGSFRTSRYSAGSAYTPPETPTLRMGSSARFGGQIARSPLSDKSPTVFGVCGPLGAVPEPHLPRTVVLVTRSTSPTPPCNSSFLRAKRADMEATLTVEVPRPHFRPHCVSSGSQADEREAARAAAMSPTPQTPARLGTWAAGRISALNTSSAKPTYTARLPTYSPSYSRPTDLPLRTPSYRPDLKTDEAKPNPRIEPPKPKSPAPPPDAGTDGSVKKSPSASKLKKSKSTKVLPPPGPKTEPPQRNSVVNKDFRKSTLNMDPSASGESLDKSPSKSNLKKGLGKSASKSKVSPSAPKVTLDPPKTGKSSQVTKTLSVSESDSSSDEESSSESSDTSEESSDDERAKGRNLLTVSSRTSTQLSSADEGAPAEKPPKPPLSPRAARKSEGGKLEEAKTVVVRTLALSGPMKVKYPATSSSAEDVSEKSQKGPPPEGSVPKTQAPRVASVKDVPSKLSKCPSKKALANSAEPVPEEAFFQSANYTPGLNRIHQKVLQERAYPLTTMMYKIRKMDSGDRAWWMESTTDVPGIAEEGDPGLKKTKSSKSIPGLKKDKSSKSIPGGQSLQVPGQKENQAPALKKTASLKSLPGLQRVASNKSLGELQRNSSCKSLPRCESRKSLQGSESSSSEVASTPTSRPAYRICRIESGDREWWLDPEQKTEKSKARIQKKDGQIFVGNFVNIDHVLGTLAPPPAALRTPRDTGSEDSDSGEESSTKMEANAGKVHDGTAKNSFISPLRGMIKLDDTALQLYKDGDYGAYLDLEASIDEQQEEFDSFSTNRKNSIVLRTQLSVRVHTIIEKLLNSEGRELRRALFSLKQIFQEDKDLVHEFVQNDGLACLIRVGTDADQNYQNYILRALGQIMLYVDGMNGVIDHPATVQWLYSLVASKFRLVVKTALKLLLVFVEYVETNCVLLVKAIRAVDYVHSARPWSNIMKLMKEYDAADTELLIYAMSLINKTLNGLPDQDMYYDQVDALEEQGLESVIRRYMAKQGTDLDLLRQFQIYEAVLQHEDGEEKGTPLRQLDETIRKAIRNRKSLTATLNPVERRKSRRNSTGNTPLTITLTPTRHVVPEILSPAENVVNGDGLAMTPSLRRRRERAERQRSFIREQREATLRAQLSSSDQSTASDDGLPNGNCAVTTNGHSLHNGVENHNDSSGCREGSVKDLTQKLATTLNSPGDDNKLLNGPFGDMKGIVFKAKEGLAKSQSRGEVNQKEPRPPEVKKTETELHWEELVASCRRELCLCDLDFRELASDDDVDVLAPGLGGAPGAPPPPPPAPAPPSLGIAAPKPPPPGGMGMAAPKPPPPTFPSVGHGGGAGSGNKQTAATPPSKKTKKTVKLFWKEVRDDPIVVTKMNSLRLLWDELSPVQIDTQKLEHLFESRAKDLITKKQQEMNKNKEIIVLDPKRSNAINIGMTKLPPPRSIKTAILKMDATVMNREGIEKLLTMLPSEEERSKIQEAQAANPDLPLGSAEQFLLTLASISELDARLKLWAFKLDYENSEKEIAEPLMDLKQGMETLKANKSFRAILGTLLSIGIFLNGAEVKGFQIEYLSKVPEVKDTVHKHSLLHHLCYMVMEKFPDSTDLYSEIGAVTRASKVDFEELSGNIIKMEQECKASFDHLKIISKHDGTTNMKLKMSDFLADCAERIIVLGKVHRRIVNRFHKFCLWLGIPLHRVSAVKPNELCRIVSEFALEYRTTRERVLQQLEKKASHRERNKTRGKMITEVGKFRSQEDRADAELKELLGSEKLDKPANHTIHGSLPWRRTRKEAVLSPGDGTNGNLTDADDEIIESLVKTATKTPVSRTTPRERKRTRNADRKSLIKRSRTRENVPCEGQR